MLLEVKDLKVYFHTLFETPYFTTGHIELDKFGQNLRSISFIVRIQNGKYEVVWPLNIQNKKPQILSQK